MKVCIVTVYDSINSGSFWQAFALGRVLKNRGHEVCYFQRSKKGASSSPVTQLKHILKLASGLHFREIGEYRKQISQFKEQISGFQVIDKSSADYREIDCFVLGSDTIWNINTAYFKDAKPVFWGDVFEGRRVFSYAGSVANTKAEEFQPVREYADSVARWTGISVRDEHTKSVLSGFTDREITRVCDPTLLLTAGDYQTVCEKKAGNYIFVYLFDPLNKAQNDALKAFAQKNRLKIVVGTFRNVVAGADEFIINSPRVFMEHMLGADYVVTDTYHGTIFSTNFQKNVVIINRNKNKVNEYLSDIGLEDRLLNDGEDIASILSRSADYAEGTKRIQSIREASLRFLDRNLAEKPE